MTSVPVPERSSRPEPDGRQGRGAAERRLPLPRAVTWCGHLLRAHWLFAVLFTLGLALRVLAQIAYYPALLYIDSYRYLANLYTLNPTWLDPVGYDWFLRPLLAAGNFTVVAALQHVMGLAIALLCYGLLRRLGVRRWIAAVAVAPVLLDAYQVQIEENLLSEALFELLIVAGLVIMLWRRPPRLWALGLGSVLVGMSVAVRTIGEVMVIPLAVYALVAVPGWRRRIAAVCVAVVGFAAPVVAYAGYYHAWTGRYALTNVAGDTLYGRAATFADCSRLRLPLDEYQLCPSQPIGQRPGVDDFAHGGDSPVMHMILPRGIDPGAVQQSFAVTVIEHQPLAFAKAVGVDFWHAYELSRAVPATDTPVSRWQFQTYYPTDFGGEPGPYTAYYSHQGAPQVFPRLTSILRNYQLHGGYTPGPLMAVALVLAVAGCLAWSRRFRASRLRGACLLLTISYFGLVLGADVFEFSWRYQLPGFILLPAAGALAVTGLTSGKGGLLAPYPDEVDRAALIRHDADHPKPSGAPIVIVIAAYNEAGAIAPVLANLPRTCLGMEVDVLVVVDGATDGTADAARSVPGIRVCEAPVNRGQGAALRLGYRLAVAGGARYVVTTDADGQYDIGELPVMIRELVEDRADFVTGSRVLGHAETHDVVRRAGTRFYAWLVSRLTGHAITDTSFGLRAMRAEVADAVTLEQPQYQSSELLISTLALGYRVVELPMTMRLRAKGRSKKGNNLVYGARYARVVVRTWWRERRRMRDRAAAPVSGSGSLPAPRSGVTETAD